MTNVICNEAGDYSALKGLVETVGFYVASVISLSAYCTVRHHLDELDQLLLRSYITGSLTEFCHIALL